MIAAAEDDIPEWQKKCMTCKFCAQDINTSEYLCKNKHNYCEYKEYKSKKKKSKNLVEKQVPAKNAARSI